ncbi:MAG: hypothetical protein IKE49_01110 [Firmicutes bacterium]|nr:hypothetical protein [Bacillota bacterium]
MKRKLLIMVTAIVLAIAMMPAMAFAGTSSDEVTVKFSAGTSGAFDMVDESITATGNLAEIFFPAIKDNEPEGVSFADVLVAAHIEKYGAGKVHDNLDISSATWGTRMNKQFGHEIVGFYYQNNSALTGSVSDPVQSGDVLFAGAYSDYTYADLFTTFSKKTYKATAGKQFNVQLSSDNWSTAVTPSEIKMAKVNKNTGKFTLLTTAYSNGTAKTTINNAGVYYISAKGVAKYEIQDGETGDMVETTGPCVGALAKVTVGLDKVKKLKKKKAYKKKIALKWKKVTGAKKYQVYRATKKNGTFKKVGTTAKITFTNKNLKKNKKYFYKVRAIATVSGKTYRGEYSSVVGIKTKK